MHLLAWRYIRLAKDGSKRNIKKIRKPAKTVLRTFGPFLFIFVGLISIDLTYQHPEVFHIRTNGGILPFVPFGVHGFHRLSCQVVFRLSRNAWRFWRCCFHHFNLMQKCIFPMRRFPHRWFGAMKNKEAPRWLFKFRVNIQGMINFPVIYREWFHIPVS